MTRRVTLAEATDDGQMLYRTALDLLERAPLSQRVRLTGVSVQDMAAPAAQQSLFAPTPSRAQKLNAALDRIVERFGEDAVRTGDIAPCEPGDIAPREARGKNEDGREGRWRR
jgi:DNA polymerase-4